MAKIEALSVHFEERGSGFPLLCLPGALGTGISDLSPQLEAWSRCFRVIAPDLRGYGQSRPPDRDFSGNFFERDADDVDALMSALRCDRFYAAGWSDGANTAALLAARHPQRVSKLVIWGGNSFISSTDVEGLRRTRPIETWPKRRRQALEAIYGESLERLWNSYCDGMERLYASGGDICRTQLHLILCPTLVLHGQLDPLVSEEHAQTFLRGIGESHGYLFPDGRHNVQHTHAEEFNRAVIAFLSN